MIRYPCNVAARTEIVCVKELHLLETKHAAAIQKVGNVLELRERERKKEIR